MTQPLGPLDDRCLNSYSKATRRIECLTYAGSWREPFISEPGWLRYSAYLDFDAEENYRPGRWLPILHVDSFRCSLGEALEPVLLSSLDFSRMAGCDAALTADEEPDYGQIELDDGLVQALRRSLKIRLKVSD